MCGCRFVICSQLSHWQRPGPSGSSPTSPLPPSPHRQSIRTPINNQFSPEHSIEKQRRSREKRISLRVEKDKIHIDFRKDVDDTMLEKGLDRIEAEKRLESTELGDYLLRYRKEGSAALSLKGTSGILHIKLEQRNGEWIIGEGPTFRTISSAMQYYRRHPLPIRGSDHVLLNSNCTRTGHF